MLTAASAPAADLHSSSSRSSSPSLAPSPFLCRTVTIQHAVTGNARAADLNKGYSGYYRKWPLAQVEISLLVHRPHVHLCWCVHQRAAATFMYAFVLLHYCVCAHSYLCMCVFYFPKQLSISDFRLITATQLSGVREIGLSHLPSFCFLAFPSLILPKLSWHDVKDNLSQGVEKAWMCSCVQHV